MMKTVKQNSKKEGHIVFEQQGTFHFTVEKIYRSGNKTVAIGKFASTGLYANSVAPENFDGEPLKLDQTYCLKKAIVEFTKENEHPQHRNHWDFIRYEGDHLREILAVNNEVERMMDDMSRGEHIGNTYACAAIEPLYLPISPRKVRSYEEKLDCMLQIVAGLQELSAIEIGRGEITAHRDIKFSNAMMDPAKKGLHIRLIDFSSIKIEDNEFDPNKTVEGAFSPSNTAPEDVLDRFEVSEKTDVFALGIMLAEIFEVWNIRDMDTSNPLAILFQQDKDEVDLNNTAKCKRYYERLVDEYDDSPRWLEKALDLRFQGIWPDEAKAPGLKELFYDSISLDPDRRVDLAEFSRRLLEIKENLPQKSEEKEYRIGAFLIDCTNIESYREQYIERALKVIEEWKDGRPHLIAYQRSADPDPISMEELGTPNPHRVERTRVEDVLSDFHSLPEYKPESSDEKSDLLITLGYLSRYLENRLYRDRFLGEIHIFTPTLPTKKEMRSLAYIDPEPIGGERIRMHSVESLVTKMESPRIIVHGDQGEAESWYTVRYLKKEKKTIFNMFRKKKKESKDSGLYFTDENGNKVYIQTEEEE